MSWAFLKYATLFMVLLFIFNNTIATEWCVDDVYNTCIDGRKLLVRECIDGELINTSKECGEYYVPSVCTKDLQLECWDGSIITTHFCVDGKPEPSNIFCPEQQLNKTIKEGYIEPEQNEKGSDTFIIILAILIFAIGFMHYLRWKKNKNQGKSDKTDKTTDLEKIPPPPSPPPNQPYDGPEN